MNFWYLPKSVEDDKLLENDARTTGEHEQDENTFLKDKEIDVNVKRRSKTGEDKIKEKDNSKAEENMATVNETGPVPYTAGELIGLSRDIEAMIGEALGDVTKVNIFGFSKSWIHNTQLLNRLVVSHTVQNGNIQLDIYLTNIKHFPCLYTVISTRVEIGKTRNCVETRRPKDGVFSHNSEFSQFPRVLI
jgi:hypothetical protein